MEFMSLPPVKAFMKMIPGVIDYNGRTSRSDYWWAILAVFIVSLVVNFIGRFMGFFGSLIIFLVSVVLFALTLPMTIRRLHDINKPFYWIFTGLLFGIPLIILCAKQGDDGDNAYGSDPTSNYGY